jgi:hypothetical protein
MMKKDPVDALMGPAPGEGEEEPDGDEMGPEPMEAPEAPAAPDDSPATPEEPPAPERPPEEVMDSLQTNLDELRGAIAKLSL